jgi:type IV secretion system protein VirB10
VSVEESAAGPDGVAPLIAGERRSAVVARSYASLQSKVQNVLAAAVVALLGGGFLTWYYHGIAETRAQATRPVKPSAVQAEMKLPPLGPSPTQPRASRTEVASALVDPQSVEGKTLLAMNEDDRGLANTAGQIYPAAAGYQAAAAPPAPDPVLQRKLTAPVLIRGTGGNSASQVAEEESRADGRVRDLDGQRGGRPQDDGSASGNGLGSGSALAGMLRPTRTAAVAAGVMPDRRWLLPKGAFIDCTLETAIDSSLPGMTTCIVATDAWSADGSVVLLERGTKLVGETRGEVRQGQERLFVLWSEARTPTGVLVELASPGTDELGRSGVTGEVDTHFAARFGAAILISLIDAGTAALVAAQSNGGSSVVIAPQAASSVVSEVLRQTVNVPPTIRVAQGGRMQVLVARDVSFEWVYALAHR